MTVPLDHRDPFIARHLVRFRRRCLLVVPRPTRGDAGYSAPKRDQWPRMRNELFAADWDMLLCSAGLLSALLRDQARIMASKAIDTGSLDSVLLTDPTRTGSSGAAVNYV